MLNDTKQLKSAIGRFLTAENKLSQELLAIGQYLAYQSLVHGNKQPMRDIIEPSEMRVWAKRALKRCLLPANVSLKEDTEEAERIALEHAEKILGLVLDKKQDDSDAAKKRRAAAAKKRQDDKQYLAKLERENADLQAAVKGDGAAVKSVKPGRGTIHFAGQQELVISEAEYQAALDAIEALRKAAQQPAQEADAA